MYDFKAAEIDAAAAKKAANKKPYKPRNLNWTAESRRIISMKRKITDERKRSARGNLRKINYEHALSQAATRGE
jgi:hypothetical protein